MQPIEIARELAAIRDRAPGTDAERRAALRLRDLLATTGRDATLEPVWVRPQWPLVMALHAALAIGASVLAISQPIAAVAVLGVVLVSAALDLDGEVHLLRRLTPERATQNVVSEPTEATARGSERVVRLVIAAHYDAPRSGLAYRDFLRRPAAALQRAGGGALPSAFATMVLAIAVLTGAVGARVAGSEAGWVDAVQLGATVILLIAVALLADIALSQPTPGANHPASGAAVALSLAAALDRSPPRRLGVEVVLAGAGDGPALGMRAFVRGRRRSYPREATAVLFIGPCGGGRPHFWRVDGALIPRRLHTRMVALADEIAPAHGALGHRGHGTTGAYFARTARWPAIAVGTLDAGGLAPRARRQQDTGDRLDPAAMSAALDFCEDLVRALDDDLAVRPGPPSP